MLGIVSERPPPLPLEQYLQASLERYEACIGDLPPPQQLSKVSATARFHYLKLDGNGRPKGQDLAKNLAYHIIHYCFTVQKRQLARTDVDLMELRDEARRFFRDQERSGEAGEMLLYFLLEAVLSAPQMVSKISLKTNPKLETFGSDGIHMKWNDTDRILDLYFGEAKLYTHLPQAASEAVESIEKFHSDRQEEFELRMVSGHFKHAEGSLKDEVLKYVSTGTSTETLRINHACLFGYNSDAYQKIPQGDFTSMVSAFEASYRSDQKRIADILEERFERFREKRLRFEIFILPFTSIDEFRQAFLDAL